jgi:hypothetical protein
VYTTNSSPPGVYSQRRRRLLPIEFVVESMRAALTEIDCCVPP